MSREEDTYEVRVPPRLRFKSDRVIERHTFFWTWLFVLGVLAVTLLVAAALPAMPESSFEGLEDFAALAACFSTLCTASAVVVSILRSRRKPARTGRHNG